MERIRWIIWVLAGMAAHGQGTVNLNNYFTPAGFTDKAYIWEWDYHWKWNSNTSGRKPYSKQNCHVEILDVNGNVIKSGGLGANGLFFFGVAEIPGTQPGGAGIILIRAWDTRYGSTFGEAKMRGQQSVTLRGLGGGGIPPPGLGTVGDFEGLDVMLLTPPGPAEEVTLTNSGADQLSVGGLGWWGFPYRIWASTNLMDWVESGSTTIARPQVSPNSWKGYLQWTFQPPAIPTFFRIEPIQWEPNLDP